MEYKVLDQSAFMLFMTLNLSVAFVVIVMACVCWKRQIPKNELLGLEGMVKLKNPDEVVVTTIVRKSESQAELNSSTVSNADSDKRASTAAHRSLPDIPMENGDTGSELYETVADKRLLEATQDNQSKNDSPNLKKQASVSQHSSISQADDVSSPYSRVKNSPHDYAKVISTEHPYAQLNAPPSASTSAAATSSVSAANVNNNVTTSDANNRSSHNSGSNQDLNDGESQIDIPAASAIAGMISASQDLPYMTPPVGNQHFSGDSQDSSKGYTSITVREPLANIIGQQQVRQNKNIRSSTNAREVSDSHYATVSDDSDETYAAIEDSRNNPNVGADIYTSGSETYAQIQPMMQSVVVSVEINNSTAPSSSYHSIQALTNSSSIGNNISMQPHGQTLSNRSSIQAIEHVTSALPPVDCLRAQMHSRQASSSSNHSSSVGNLGSPKPEKRQANSPLPPTPKSSGTLQTASNNSLTSGRSSVISVIELTGETPEMSSSSNTNENSPFKKHKSLSPSKDIEGMYAKVIKKNKFSTRDSPPSKDNSPVMTRKHNSPSTTTAMSLGITPLDAATAALLDAQKISISTSEKNRSRCNSYGAKDHGYETIPADVNRKSDCYTNILQKERQQMDGNASPNAEHQRLRYSSTKPPNNNSVTPPTTHSSASTINIKQNVSYQSDKHYETIAGSKNSSDPGYETLIQSKHQINEDNEKKSSDYDPNYEVLKGPDNPISAGLSDDGYAKVIEKKPLNLDEEDSIDGYSKVKGEEAEDGYSTIREFKENIDENNRANHNYASISEAKSPMPDLLNATASTPIKPSSTLSLEQSNEHKIRPNELPAMLSPSSFTSSSQLNTSSAASSANLTTSTMSTFSSRQTPSSSQYESLTGSDTDPNYESVSYIQTNRSNSSAMHSYERLNAADLSDTQLSNNSPDGGTSHSIGTSGAAIVLNVSTQPLSPLSKTPTQQSPSSTDTQNEVTVDDYFQV